jgi:phosphoribosylamine-glycine ligase
MNVLSVLETDLLEIFQAIVEGTLDRVEIRFRPCATVCKYIVPEGYPDDPVKGEKLDLSALPPDSDSLRSFAAALDQHDGQLIMSGSRALALVGIGASLEEAERIAEEAARSVRGRVRHRSDIGTARLINRRVEHMTALGQCKNRPAEE